MASVLHGCGYAENHIEAGKMKLTKIIQGTMLLAASGSAMAFVTNGVPEPSSAMLLGAGAIAVGIVALVKRNKK